MRLNKFFILFFFFSACINVSKFSKEDIEQEKNIIKSKIAKEEILYIQVKEFKNESQVKEIDYLSNAIPDLIIQYLFLFENENAYLPLKIKYTNIASDISKNSYFFKYLTNIVTTITQFSTNISREISNIELIETNILKQKNKNILEFKTITNILTNEVTNIKISNIMETNLPILTEKNFYLMISNEFPELENEITALKIVLSKTEITNSIYSSIITGKYKISKDSKASGPKMLEIEINTTNFLTSTNVTSYKITSREDTLNENIILFIKPYRKFILNKPTGDLIINSSPEEVDVYINGIFLGKTPLYFPSIESKAHKITFSKEGYKRTTMKYIIQENKTNLIFYDLEENKTGGKIKIDSTISNSRVFINSIYKGKTPLTVSNLTLFDTHRVVVYPPDTNLSPFYYNFILNKADEDIEINASFKTQIGNTETFKKTMWGLSFFSWGLTLTFVGLDVYNHYLSEYHKDQYYSYKKTEDNYYYQYYDYMSKIFYNYFLFSTMFSMGMTALALNSEDIYIGIYQLDNKTLLATVNLRF
ncbi:MAG: PEGA domain-containing protein [Brevinematales bacterium]|nr:PEGA domain-containing protein [Brevinematales bacterium]